MGSGSIIRRVEDALAECEKIKAKHCFTAICSERALEKARELDERFGKGEEIGPLAGKVITVKDSVCVSGVETTAGSSILRGFIPAYSATAVERVEKAGGVVVAKTIMDEFGFGGFGISPGRGFPLPEHPFLAGRVPGGSSSGCGVATALLGSGHASIAESTGGSITSPACFCGVVGITPTYGRVSRFGLIDYATSLDKLGAMGKTVDEAAALLEVMQGFDLRDSTSSPVACNKLTAEDAAGKKWRFAVPSEMLAVCDDAVRREVEGAIKEIEAAGAVVQDVSLKTVELSVPAYYILASAEASTTLARYQGLCFGARDEVVGRGFKEYAGEIRAREFGWEAKRRLILGSFARTAGYRGKYYLKAAKARRAITMDLKRCLTGFDALILPSMPIYPPMREDAIAMQPEKAYAADVCTVPQSLAGMPHSSIPIKAAKLPAGVQLVCKHFEEKKLVEASRFVEAVIS